VLSLNARQIGVGKPHPLCFERLAEELRVAPEEIVYVGDDPALDVEAARAAGLRTAWVNRFDQQWPDTIAPADIVVTNCTQLADSLGV
jgi:putative hydrolase of the HAD superfamily